MRMVDIEKTLSSLEDIEENLEETSEDIKKFKQTMRCVKIELSSLPYSTNGVKRERPHAIWRQTKLCVPKGRGQTYMVWKCTGCHSHKKVRTPYCPECGAEMEDT